MKIARNYKIISINQFSAEIQTYYYFDKIFMTAIRLLGRKIGMTQVFNNIGNVIPITILQLGPCFITQIKTIENHGYNAIQIGYEIVKNTKLNKSELGHLNKFQLPNVKYLKEFRVETCDNFTIGQMISIADLKIGNYINVKGKSIGKGFAGYQKRHNFTRGPMSHGSKNHRQPGSIGAGTTPGRVFPGKKMAGRMGYNQITIKNLEIIDIKTEDNLLLVKGSVPGKSGNLISITTK